MNGVELIAEERKRQIEKWGWSSERDDRHTENELAKAARCYADNLAWMLYPRGEAPPEWPWERYWWKPEDDPLRNLIKAGALIAAEIDRLQRKRGRA